MVQSVLECRSGPSGMITFLTWLGHALVWSQRNYQSLVRMLFRPSRAAVSPPPLIPTGTVAWKMNESFPSFNLLQYWRTWIYCEFI